MDTQSFSFSFEKLKPITELRGLLDSFAARHAAINVKHGADSNDLLNAFEALQKLAKERDFDGRKFVEADRKLHLEIVALSDVDGLASAWTTVSNNMLVYNIDTLKYCWPDLNILIEQHAEIVDAICDGDIELSGELAEKHLDSLWYRLPGGDLFSESPKDPLAKVCAYLAFHYDQKVTLNFLAKYIAHLSPGHLSRLFQSRYKIGYSGYLKEIRMQKAAELLRVTHNQVKYIALCVGYKDPSRFAEHFKEKFSITPSEYLDRHNML